MIRAILFAALGGAAFALLVPGQSDWLMLCLPCALASLFLLLRRPEPTAPPPAQVIVDGSNVMHWEDGRPALAPVKAVLEEIARRSLTPGVIFDANVGYKIGTRYQGDSELARQLGLPATQVLVVPKGTPADDYILRAARDLGAKIVSNDRFRDWKETYPEVMTDRILLRGSYQAGRLKLASDLAG